MAGCLFVVDLCIVTQDLDFPHFENSLEVMLLGTNIAFEGHQTGQTGRTGRTGRLDADRIHRIHRMHGGVVEVNDHVLSSLGCAPCHSLTAH